jgi:hypothetical protein
MDDPPPPGRNLELRASDAEREHAVQALHAAVTDGRLPVDELEGRVQSAYTVRTRRELELLIADVSVQPLGERPLPAPAASGNQLEVREGPGGSRWVIAVLSGHDRRGRWRVGKRCTVVNVMGGSGIDLNDAELADRVTEVNVYSFWGGGEIRVPDGVAVHVSDFALMGANDVKLGDQVVPEGGPVIHIRLVSIMSGVAVVRGRRPSKEDRRKERELRKAKRRGELEQ